MKVVALFGEPGSGKSTLMTKLMERLGVSREFKSDFKLVPYHQKDNVYILGKYEIGETFGGTDKMSMAVQPEAIKFLASLDKESIVIFEGDRLCTSSFLEHCNDKYELTMVYLSTSKSIREERYKERNSNQDETWLKGRESKISNILSNLSLKFVTEVFTHNEKNDSDKIVDFIMEKIK
jgi:dephospho-CoA kinase